jgi:hypothetical protein
VRLLDLAALANLDRAPSQITPGAFGPPTWDALKCLSTPNHADGAGPLSTRPPLSLLHE